LIPNPIRRVLSTIQAHRVQALLMGGQACVLYGAAEFSRDTDFAVFSDAANLGRLQAALDELQAEGIALPPFTADHLARGHAVHFRCRHPEALNLRVDVMARLRGVADFPVLWERRTSVVFDEGAPWEVMALPDLVQAKKTQRDKDWPMIRRLVEASYLGRPPRPSRDQTAFWLRELRTSELLVELTDACPELSRALAVQRPLLAAALTGDLAGLESALDDEMRREREADRAYWRPLKAELERMRHARLGAGGPPAG
jgi:hypothetical protein